jgi:hypothetical protein
MLAIGYLLSCAVLSPMATSFARKMLWARRNLEAIVPADHSKRQKPTRFLRIRCEKSGASFTMLATGLMYACSLSSEKRSLPAKYPPR